MEKSKTLVLCESILKAAKSKNVFLNENSINKYLKTRKIKNSKPYKLPLSMALLFIKQSTEKMDYYSIGKNNEKIIIYFHGGAFINQPLLFHFSYLKKLNKKTNAKIIVPIYPLAPNNTYIETYQALDEFYSKITKENPTSKIIFMGDSAGGTLCFSYYNHIKNKFKNLPIQIIAFSPCVDTRLSNPEIEAFNSCDIMLHSYGCRIAIQKWLAGSNEINEEINPFFSHLSDLPQSLIIIGTKEIMYPDVLKFEQLAKDQNANLTVNEQKEFGHCYPLFPIPESKIILEEISNLIKNI